MSWSKVLNFFVLVFVAVNASANTVTESWLRQAGISCGGGLSVAAQGEIDAAVLKRLRVGSVQGEGKYQISEAESLLDQFQKEEKRETYKDYVNCLKTIMSMAIETANLPPKDVALDSSVAIASLETVRRGQRFVMIPTDTLAIKDYSIIFTVTKISETRVSFIWSNSETGKDSSGSGRQAELIKIGKDCTLIPYKVDGEKKQVSFLSNC